MTFDELIQLQEKEIEEKFKQAEKALGPTLEDPAASPSPYDLFKAGYIASKELTGNQATFYLKENNPFLAKVLPDEPIFILRAQDNTAPGIVLNWIAKNLDTVEETRLKQAYQTVLAMRRYAFRRDPT